jgi:predicted acyltransferase
MSILRPEVGNRYLVYPSKPSQYHVLHGLVMGDHMRLSKSSDRKDENFSKAGVVLNSLGSSWSLVLWSIKRSTRYSQTAKSGYG